MNVTHHLCRIFFTHVVYLLCEKKKSKLWEHCVNLGGGDVVHEVG